MADAKDVATAVQAALDEIGVTGTLDVTKDGDEAAKTIGRQKKGRREPAHASLRRGCLKGVEFLDSW